MKDGEIVKKGRPEEFFNKNDIPDFPQISLFGFQRVLVLLPQYDF